jgi:hypothetical protein
MAMASDRSKIIGGAAIVALTVETLLFSPLPKIVVLWCVVGLAAAFALLLILLRGKTSRKTKQSSDAGVSDTGFAGASCHHDGSNHVTSADGGGGGD